MELFSLNTEMRQELRLNAQLLQSMEILRMSSQELLEHVGKLSEENPVLELSESGEISSAFDRLRKRASWIDGGVSAATFAHGDEEMPEPGATDREMESLSSFLCDQLSRLRLDKPMYALCKYLVMMVDDDGFLNQEDIDSLLERGIPQDMTDKALTVIQALEPAGVCARSLQECLSIQLKRMKAPPAAAIAIVESHLAALGRKHYGLIAKELGLTLEQINEAQAVIAGLEPRPGAAFYPEEPVLYVRPDIYVIEEDGALQTYINEYYLPRITVSDYYLKLLKDSDDQETQEYLRSKVRQVKSLLDSLSRRGSTLRRCMDSIVEKQQDFFLGRTDELKPLLLSKMADTLDLHTSTISRAVHEKYIQSRQGVFPMRYFFSRAVGEEASRQAIKQRLLRLIQSEDHCRPYSDQRLCQLLEREGIYIARRTAAQYRSELKIEPSSVRKHGYK